MECSLHDYTQGLYVLATVFFVDVKIARGDQSRV